MWWLPTVVTVLTTTEIHILKCLLLGQMFGIVAKMPLHMLALHNGAPCLNYGLFMTACCDCAPWKATGDSSNIWVPDTHVEELY